MPRPALYTCRPRTALHVATGELLRSRKRSRSDLSRAAAGVSGRKQDSVEATTSVQPEAVAPTETELRSERIASSGRAGPKRCSDAIEKGLAQFAEGQYEDAIDMFTHALELPGKGFVRSADSTREHACPSEGEERAALYNMACCYAQLEEVDSGLSVLQGLLENGFDDYDTLRTDEDIAPLRAEADFEALLSKAEQRGKGFFGQRKRQRGRGLLDRW